MHKSIQLLPRKGDWNGCEHHHQSPKNKCGKTVADHMQQGDLEPNPATPEVQKAQHLAFGSHRICRKKRCQRDATGPPPPLPSTTATTSTTTTTTTTSRSTSTTTTTTTTTSATLTTPTTPTATPAAAAATTTTTSYYRHHYY